MYVSLKCFLFLQLFIKIQVINFQIPYFLAKRMVKFISGNTANNPDLSHRLMVGLRQHYRIFSAANWSNNTTSSFPPVNWRKFSPVQIASCRNVNYVVGSFISQSCFY